MSAPEPGLGSPTGQLITFYSYKGGTGRTMALANIACLLAGEGAGTWQGRVLMIDWDLEAPGLHRFFRKAFDKLVPSGVDPEEILDAKDGLLELLTGLRKEVLRSVGPKGAQDQDSAEAMLAGWDFTPFILKTDNPRLHLLKAGRQDDGYAEAIGTFNWEELFNRSPWLFRAMVDRLTRDYEYVLVDSRTGETDTSGICTKMLPEKLVVVFTPNRQSLTGVGRLVRQAVDYRRRSEDPRPLVVFPLPSRLDSTFPTLVSAWRDGSSTLGIDGYRHRFEGLFKEVYAPQSFDLGEYFKEVELQYIPEYSFGEEIAVRAEKGGSRLSFSKSYETFARWLVDRAGPWESTAVLEARAKEEAERHARRSLEEQGKKTSAGADAAFAKLSPEEQAVARRVLLRLVQLPYAPGSGPEAQDDPTPRTVALAEFPPADLPIIERLGAVGLLTVSPVGGPLHTATLAQEGLIRWQQLRSWVRENRAFLASRQKLDLALAEWVERGRQKQDLLAGGSLEEARKWLRGRPEDLNALEQEYLRQSLRAANWRKVRGFGNAAVGVGVFGVIAAQVIWGGSRNDRAILAAANGTTDPLERTLLLAELKRPSQDAKDLLRTHAGDPLPVVAVGDLAMPLRSLDFSPDARRVVIVDNNGAVQVLPADGRGPALRLVLSQEALAAAFVGSASDSGQVLYIVASDGDLQGYDVGARRPLFSRRLAPQSGPQQAAGARIERARFSPDGRSVLGVWGGRASLTRVREEDTVTTWFPFDGGTALGDLAVSNGGARVAAINASGGIALFRADAPRSPILDYSRQFFESVRLSANGQRLAAISRSSKVYALDLAQFGALYPLGRPSDPAVGAGLDATGSRFAVGYQDGRTEVWRIDPGWALLATLAGQTSAVRSLTFDRGGSRLVTASDDRTLRIWNLDRIAPAPGGSFRALIDSLLAGTTVCLDPSQRVRAGLESDSTRAYESFRDCERRYGRTGVDTVRLNRSGGGSSLY